MYKVGVGAPASLAKARSWAAKAVAAAGDQDCTNIIVFLEEVKRLQATIGEEQHRLNVEQAHQHVLTSEEFEEVMSHYPHLPNGERQKYKSMYMQQMKLSTGNGASSSNAAEASGVHASTAVGGSSYSIPAANSSTRCGSNGSSRQAEPISKETLTCAQELASCGTLYSEQKLAKARELCDAGVAAWRGKDVSTAVSKLSAAYILSPEIVYEHMQRHSESSYSSYANWTQDLYKWVSCHANDLDSLILSSYIAGTARGRPWLVQRLGDVVLPKIEAPVVKGLVLLNRAELQVADDALAGALSDTDLGLQLIPNNPDMLYNRAIGLKAYKWDKLPTPGKTDSKQRIMRTLQRRKQVSAEVIAAYEHYLKLAPLDHHYRPHAHYYLGYVLIVEGMYADTGVKTLAEQQRCRQESAAVYKRVEGLYHAGLAAEALIPKQCQPVSCAAKAGLPGMLALRRPVGHAADASGSSGSSRDGGSTVQAAVSKPANSGDAAAAAGSSSNSRSKSSTHSSSSSRKPKNSDDGSSMSKGASGTATAQAAAVAGSVAAATAAVPPGVPAKPVCCSCGVVVSKVRRCSGCKQAIYCSRDCQVAHWKQHKKSCGVQEHASE